VPERPDKQDRKAVLRRVKAQQRSAARDKLPLPNHLLRSLFDTLETELPVSGCDDTLKIVRGWLQERRIPEDSVVEWLRENGGFCDCEALANAEQAWEDAIHDAR
jgi:uncharacterized protein DUF2695